MAICVKSVTGPRSSCLKNYKFRSKSDLNRHASSNTINYQLDAAGNGGSNSTGRVEYIYLPTETGSATLIGLYKDQRYYAVHTDHLGTPRKVTDDTAKVVWQWAYSAFGDNKPTGILKATTNPKAAITNQPKLLTATSPTITMNLRFPGQYWDDEAKLSYNYMRSYRPQSKPSNERA